MKIYLTETEYASLQKEAFMHGNSIGESLDDGGVIVPKPVGNSIKDNAGGHGSINGGDDETNGKPIDSGFGQNFVYLSTHSTSYQTYISDK